MMDFNDPATPERFVRDLAAAAGFRCCGAFQLQAEDPEWLDFIQPLESGRVSGSFCRSSKTVYLDLFVKGFFDPRRTAELAVELLGGTYYRMQPQVRN